eukprot:TRINITY_DN67028_c5_g3_i8.p1 TRINITY_DN67028_c5_g3~~TRINITY_DN67028_c5_g3_i8.p1  ORF type:complete len:366 (+),score=25.35 TRINITY_DN67028_c5_g3_i8:48-1145(+)
MPHCSTWSDNPPFLFCCLHSIQPLVWHVGEVSQWDPQRQTGKIKVGLESQLRGLPAEIDINNFCVPHYPLQINQTVAFQRRYGVLSEVTRRPWLSKLYSQRPLSAATAKSQHLTAYCVCCSRKVVDAHHQESTGCLQHNMLYWSTLCCQYSIFVLPLDTKPPPRIWDLRKMMDPKSLSTNPRHLPTMQTVFDVDSGTYTATTDNNVVITLSAVYCECGNLLGTLFPQLPKGVSPNEYNGDVNRPCFVLYYIHPASGENHLSILMNSDAPEHPPRHPTLLMDEAQWSNLLWHCLQSTGKLKPPMRKQQRLLKPQPRVAVTRQLNQNEPEKESEGKSKDPPSEGEEPQKRIKKKRRLLKPKVAKKTP